MKYFQKFTILIGLIWGFIAIQRIVIAIIMPAIQADMKFSYTDVGMIMTTIPAAIARWTIRATHNVNRIQYGRAVTHATLLDCQHGLFRGCYCASGSRPPMRQARAIRGGTRCVSLTGPCARAQFWTGG